MSITRAAGEREGMMMETYTFPPKDETLKRLLAVAVAPEGDLLDALVRFSEIVGGNKRNAHGVNLAFQIAITEIVRRLGAMPYTDVLLNAEYDTLMAGVISDNSRFLGQVIKVHDELMMQVKGNEHK